MSNGKYAKRDQRAENLKKTIAKGPPESPPALKCSVCPKTEPLTQVGDKFYCDEHAAEAIERF